MRGKRTASFTFDSRSEVSFEELEARGLITLTEGGLVLGYIELPQGAMTREEYHHQVKKHARVRRQPERDNVRLTIEHEATRYGWDQLYHPHFSKYDRAGFPDLTMGKETKTAVYALSVETKSRGKKPTPAQVKWLNYYASLYFPLSTAWACVWDEDDVEVAVKYLARPEFHRPPGIWEAQ